MRRFVKVGIVLTLLAAGTWLVATGPYRDPTHAMQAFLARDGAVAEEQLIDPLVLCGSPAVPHVIEYLATEGEMSPYACVFLGVNITPEGTAALRSALVSRSANKQIKSYALASLARIDREGALAIAEQHAQDSGGLGITARRLLEGGEAPVIDRSYLEALVRWKS